MALHERAKRVLPKGVTGDGRFAEPYPIAIERAEGKWLYDVDENRYLDYHGGFGTAVLGYAHPEVDASVRRATEEIGAFVGVSNPHEVALAERMCRTIPLAERVAFCGGGGSDGIYHAVRLARAVTGRTKIVKMEGGYHGWHADLGVSVRPELSEPTAAGLPQGVPNSSGSLAAVTAEVLVATVNDQGALEDLFARRGPEIAALVIEPVLYSAGCVIVNPDYLLLARKLCTRHGSLLVFDEVMSGFRSALGGAGAKLGVVADLGVFGKALANGYIIAALAGRAEHMSRLAPEGDVFYSGTFNGHPLSVAAAQSTLDVLERDQVPSRLAELGDRLARGLNDAIAQFGLNAVCQTFGSVWNLYLKTQRVRNYRDLARAMTPETQQLNTAFVRFLRERGIYIHSRHVNRGFISAAHDEGDIDSTVAITSEFLLKHRRELALS
jgi:glutamate-1-semialdehyde 2,1-aminomutase